MRNYSKELIFPIDGGEPLQGLFAVTLGKNHPERAMKIYKINEEWRVYLDGYIVGAAMNWSNAFGWIYKNFYPTFFGRHIYIFEYNRIIKARQEDKKNGIDIESAIDLNSLPPTF
jgi:hypothetical protein